MTGTIINQMSYQVLARKWRPKNFAEMIGQTQALQGLIHALDQQRLHHAYLFTGTRGVGKTSIARILAKCLNCEQGVSSKPCGVCSSCIEISEGRFPDLIEIDAASRTKVEDTREILDNVQYAPTRGRFKVYLIDEVHMLSGHSFNALLKTLEEPPAHVKFLLATTDPQKLPVTVLSRCLQFSLKNISTEDIANHLADILQKENISFEKHALTLIGRSASGSLRDALSLLDQAIAYGQGQVKDEVTASMLGSIDNQEVFAIVEALQAQDANALLASAKRLTEKGADFADVLSSVSRLLYQMSLQQLLPKADSDEFAAERVLPLAQQFSAEEIQVLYQISIMGRRDLSLAPDPRIGFEMTLLRLLAFRPLSNGSEGVQKTAQMIKQPAPVPLKTMPVKAPETKAMPVTTETISPIAESAVIQTSNQYEYIHDWAALLQQLDLAGMAKQFALNCTIYEQSEHKIILKVDEQHAKMLNDRLKIQIELALQKHFNSKIRLQIDIGKTEQETPAAADKRVTASKQQAAEEALMGDKNVHFIQAQFHAIIDKNSIKPR